MKIMLKEYIHLLMKYVSVLVEWTERGQYKYRHFDNDPVKLYLFFREHENDEISFIMMKPWDRVAEVVLMTNDDKQPRERKRDETDVSDTGQ